MAEPTRIRSAEVVLPCSELEPALSFYVEELGFRLDAIFPADDPATAVLSGHGVCLRLDREARSAAPGVLRLACDGLGAAESRERELVAPDGTRVLLVPAESPLHVPEGRASFELTRLRSKASWIAGRAGMHYRDLLPERQGGRFIASHIRIAAGGPVPDYVHHHRVRFQMIFCYRGWVRVAYEDQGPPIVMEPGDCVLQPPGIRHRVLECSAGLEVIEIGCPALHETLADHGLTLPTEHVRPERLFEGQRFLHHRAASGRWSGWGAEGFECMGTGMDAATDGLADVYVIRARGKGARRASRAAEELLFYFVLRGGVTLEREDHEVLELARGDALALPGRSAFELRSVAEGTELLEVRLPA